MLIRFLRSMFAKFLRVSEFLPFSATHFFYIFFYRRLNEILGCHLCEDLDCDLLDNDTV